MFVNQFGESFGALRLDAALVVRSTRRTTKAVQTHRTSKSRPIFLVTECIRYEFAKDSLD